MAVWNKGVGWLAVSLLGYLLRQIYPISAAECAQDGLKCDMIRYRYGQASHPDTNLAVKIYIFSHHHVMNPISKPSFALPSKSLLPMPLILPARKPRRLLQRPDLPILGHHSVPFLLPRPLLQLRHNHMLHMPCILVLHEGALSLLQHLRQQRRHVRFGSELLYRREERFEVEDDRAAKGQAAEGLPVDAEVDAGEGEVGDLEGAEVLMGVAGRHEEGCVDFEAP